MLVCFTISSVVLFLSVIPVSPLYYLICCLNISAVSGIPAGLLSQMIGRLPSYLICSLSYLLSQLAGCFVSSVAPFYLSWSAVLCHLLVHPTADRIDPISSLFPSAISSYLRSQGVLCHLLAHPISSRFPSAISSYLLSQLVRFRIKIRSAKSRTSGAVFDSSSCGSYSSHIRSSRSGSF